MTRPYPDTRYTARFLNLSDLHRHPPSSADRSQTPRPGRDHHHSLLDRQTASGNRQGARKPREYEGCSLLGAEDIWVISQVGDSVAFLRKPVRDAYYRNDSLESTHHVSTGSSSGRRYRTRRGRANVGGVAAYMKCGRIFKNFRGSVGFILVRSSAGYRTVKMGSR